MGDLVAKQLKAPCDPHPYTLHPEPHGFVSAKAQSPLPSRLLCPQISPEPEKLLLRAGCCVRETRGNYLTGLCRGECGPPYVIGNEVGYARELDWKCRRKWLYDSSSKIWDAGQTAQWVLLERSSHRMQWLLILSSESLSTEEERGLHETHAPWCPIHMQSDWQNEGAPFRDSKPTWCF